LIETLRIALIEQAKAGATTTYRELAERIGLKPPQMIHRVAEALESLMEQDAAAGRPLLAALCGSKVRPGLPAPGFFIKANELGVFLGRRDGPEAIAFWENERRRALSFYAGGADRHE
jgi:hypothetical protein